MKKLTQKGFGVVAALVALVIIFLVGFIGWRVYNSNQNTDNSSDATTAPTRNSEGNNETDNSTFASNIDFSKVSYTVTLPAGWTETDFQEQGRPCGTVFPGDWKQQELTSSNGDTVTIYENGRLRGCGGGYSSDISPTFEYADNGIKFNNETITLNCEVGEEVPFCAGAADTLFVVAQSNGNASNGFAYAFVIETSTRSDDEVSQINQLLELLETIRFSR